MGQTLGRIRFADLFCGIGGFRLALERAGAECVYANDNDKFACQVYRKHWDDGTLDERDIRDVESLPEVDLVTGGFPCQDLSVAGKRAGIRGEKSGVFFEMVRLIEQAKPTMVFLENVPGLLSAGRGRDFFIVLDTLDQLGYRLAWRILNARYFGVPQRRRRVFIVGGAGGGFDPGEVLFEREGGERDTAASDGEGEDVAYAVGSRTSRHLPGQETFLIEGDSKASTPRLPGVRPHSSGAGHTYVLNKDATPKVSEDVAMTLRPDGEGRGHSGGAQYVACGAMLRGRDGGSQLELMEDRVPALRAIQGGGGRPLVAHALAAEGADASEDGTGRGTPLTVQEGGSGIVEVREDEAPVLRANPGGGGQPKVLSDVAVRRLMPVECERLQGFPDGWTERGLTGTGFSHLDQRRFKGGTPFALEEPDEETTISDTQRYRALGNAVCVPVVEYIAKRLIGANKQCQK